MILNPIKAYQAKLAEAQEAARQAALAEMAVAVEEARVQGQQELAREFLQRVQAQPAPGVFHWDRPITFTTPSSPRRKALQILSVDDLRQIADKFDIVRSVIEHLKRELRARPIQITAVDGSDDSESTMRRIREAQSFFSASGGNGEFGRPVSDFETAWVEDLLVLGCFTIHRQYSRGGTLLQQAALDAGTIRPEVDAYGWVDPNAAFSQWIEGRQVGTRFSADAIYYGGLDARSWTPYYISPIEQIFSPILSAMSADDWNQAWLTSGNAPGDDIFTLPEALTGEQIKEYITIFDQVLAGNPQERQKAKFLPSGSGRLSAGTRKDQDFEMFQMWLLRRVAARYGVSPTSIGFEGSTYKVSQEGAQQQTSELGLSGLLLKRKELYDDTLFRMGYPDLEVLSEKRAQERKEAGALTLELGKAKFITVNEVRKANNYEPIEGGDSFEEEKEKPEPGKDDEGPKAEEARAFNPNQPRDDKGRFTSTGAASVPAHVSGHPHFEASHVQGGHAPARYGVFGPEYDGFKHDGPGAEAHLEEVQAGVAVAALHHPQVGDIDLPWGEAPSGTGKSRRRGFGLAKIRVKHPEIQPGTIQQHLSEMRVTDGGERGIELQSPTHIAAVNLEHQGEHRRWLVTMFEPKG